MKKYKNILLITIVLTVLYVATLLVLRSSLVFSAERKIDGIENVGVSFSDFEIPTDVKVVGIGEATHGNREFQTIKLEVLKKVVEEGNGRSIAFEMSAGEGAKINDAIHETDTDLTDLISTISYVIYDTEEIVELLTWMRAYNQNVPYEESLMFYGIDMQDAFESVKYMQSKAKSDPSLFTEEEKTKLLSIDADNDDLEKSRKLFEEIYNRASALDDESKLIAIQSNVVLQFIDAPDFDESQTEYGNHRDLSMAKNLKSYSELEEKRGFTQMVVTAHNGHVMKGSSEDGDNLPMGARIDEIFDGSYFCIGTEYYNTTVNIHTAGTFDEKYERANHDYCSDDILAYQAQFFDGERYCLDYTRINDEGSKVYKIIHGKNFMGMVGEGYSPVNDLEKSERMKIIPSERFDAVVYYYYVTPIDPIHY